MSASSPKDSPSLQRASSNQGIFSRLTASLSSKNRSFADFDIVLDEPLREYKAGDGVKGSIQLAVAKPLRITHLVLSLHGFAKVYKNATAPGEGLPSEVKTPSPGRGKTGTEYLGNGLISLFEDEIVLCGDGKLNVGKYSFRFEARFPSRSLPSSLSFERGTIQYVLVATLTRPTTMMPTMSREKTIPFRETLDIAACTKPKPRKLYLKALNRPRHRPKRKLTDRTLNSSSTTNPSSPEGSEHPTEEVPRSSASTASIEIGSDSVILTQLTASTVDNDIPASPTSPTTATGTQDTISASIEILKGGFLAGDYIPVRISIKHTRQIKSMQGIIVTLYRRAKIDAQPVIANSRGPAFEDPIPKSKSGLKGLTLTGRGSHIFRMDLAQAFAPLIINPTTLEAEVKTAVRVPEDAFPTVKSVPGGMFAFTYHVEVIMDLTGKLSKQDRLFTGMNMTSKSPAFSMSANIATSANGLPASVEVYHLIETSEIRREKGVAQETFEVMVGSHDSKRKVEDQRTVDIWLEEDLASSFSDVEGQEEISYDEPPRSPPYARSNDTIQPAASSSRSGPSEFHELMGEKERLRLAEDLHLPPRPHGDENLASSSRHVPASVPDLEVPDLHPDDSAPAYQRYTPNPDSMARRLEASGPPMVNPDEDKAELERQRLMAMASSPDDHEEDEAEASAPANIPSVPILEEHEYSYGSLPEYAPRR